MKEMRCLHCYSNEFSERNGHLYCVYCGSKYRQRPEDQEILLSMAYRELRFMNFLDAENAFEDIISRHPDLPEAYWGCVCARYGIKFEQDYTGKQIPTCCLPAIESILEDRYYQKALELSDEETAEWYRGQGEYLERVRKTWIERARKLAPYDVFISYKDSDQEKGLDRTEDSLKAQSIYTHLVTQGYSVFYSRESLSNVIGEKYEPYIFQALSTSRAMIVYGSTPEYINSTWVRNEWQRYAKKMQKGEKDKGSLIVICDGFSPKDLPPMLRSMQVLDGRDMFCYSKLDDHLKGLLAKKVSPEEEAKKKAEEEARKRAEAKAEAKRRAVAEAKKKADAEAKRKAEAEAKRKAEAEAKKKAEAKAKKDAAVAAELSSEKKEGGSASKKAAVIGILSAIVLTVAITLLFVLMQGDRRERELPSQDDSIEANEENPEMIGSKGLKYTSNGDGTCSVSGIGTCKDTKIVIPEESPDGDKVTRIGKGAFTTCSTLTGITIPDSVTSIGEWAFASCSALTSITIPDGVTSIGNTAFADCGSVTSITIPASVTSIGYSAFSHCYNLTSIEVDDRNTVYHDAGNCLIETAVKTLITGCKTSIIPTDGSVTSIGDGVFIGFDLTSIVIPDCVTSIGKSAFFDCSSLTSITFNGTKAQWETIEKGAEWDENTGNYTVHCTDGEIPKSEDVTADDPEISASKGLSFTSNDDGTCYISGIGSCKDTNLMIPANSPKGDRVTGIGRRAFQDCKNVTSIEIPGSVTGIRDYAFSGCENLTSITIPDSITSIGYYAFQSCKNLKSITIPDSVTDIRDYAFAGCENLMSITIPDSVTSIGWNAFEYCSSLASITIPGSIKNISPGTFCGCDNLASITMPNSITSIGDKAFYGCDRLTSITIPDSVTSIGAAAFGYCNNLTSITIPDSVTSIGAAAFDCCDSLTSITIPDSITSVLAGTFHDCSSLSGITIPASVTSIGDNAFGYCNNLTSITFQGTKAEWNAIEKDETWCINTGSYTVHCTDGDIPKSES